jgi:hypothetical protein
VAEPKAPPSPADNILLTIIKMLTPLKGEERRRIIQTLFVFFEVPQGQ